MFLITGVPGHTGSAAAETLLERGQAVTVLVRSAERGAALRAKGAEVVVGSVDDLPSLTRALNGKKGVFLMIPPNMSSADLIGETRQLVAKYAIAVKESGVPYVVFLSSVGAEQSSGTGLILTNHNGEEALKPVAKNMTILRPGSFMENWSAVLGMAKEQGILPSFFKPGRKVPHTATRDIGRFAAEALLDPAPGQRIWYIHGQDYTPEEVAQAFSKALGKEVRLQSIPETQAAGMLASQGAPENVARGYQEMTEGINAGLIAIPANAEIRQGPTKIENVLEHLLSTGKAEGSAHAAG